MSSKEMKTKLISSGSIIGLFLVCIFASNDPKRIEKFDDMYKFTSGFTSTNYDISLQVERFTFRSRMWTFPSDEARGAAMAWMSDEYLDKPRVLVYPWCHYAGKNYSDWTCLHVEQIYPFDTFKRSRLMELIDFRPSMKGFYKWSRREYSRIRKEVKK